MSNEILFKYDRLSNLRQNKLEKYTKKKERNYGIDLLRIISMINIINLHINLFSHKLYIKFSDSKYKYIWLLEVASYSAVNCFGLISGIVGYRKHNFCNVIYIWIQALFYSICKYLYFIILGKKKINKNNVIKFVFIVLMKKNWYINAYTSMYFIIPFINNGVNSINKSFHRNIIIFIIFFYSFSDIVSKIFDINIENFLNNGYSSMWLIILYIIGVYFGKYIIINNINILNFILFLILYLFSTLLSFEVHLKLIKMRSKITNRLLISNISPTMIIQSISFIMIFPKLKIENKILIKIISFLSPLTLGALFIHEIFFQSRINIISNLFNWIFIINNKLIFFKIYFIGFILYFFCIFIDYLRLLIFNLLNIRKLCQFIEKELPRLINYIIL